MVWPTPNPPPTGDWLSRRLRLPPDTDWLAIVDGALSKIVSQFNYFKEGTLTPLQTIEIMNEIWFDYGQTDAFMLGTIVPYITANPPPFCLPCDGSTFNRVDYPKLYAILDPAFIVDADTFKTPDLRGVTVIGAGLSSSGTEFDVGVQVGEETHSLTEAENGEHTHTDAGHFHSYQPPGASIVVVAPGEAPVSLPNIIPSVTGTASASIQASGSGEPHNNIQPSLPLNYAVYAS